MQSPGRVKIDLVRKKMKTEYISQFKYLASILGKKEIVVLKLHSKIMNSSIIKRRFEKKLAEDIKFIILHQKLWSDMDSIEDTQKLETAEISRTERLDYKRSWNKEGEVLGLRFANIHSGSVCSSRGFRFYHLYSS